jgi:hypothetical protein
LTANADEEQLVQAARKFIADHTGSILLIVDDVARPEEIEELLPRASSGLPAAHVLMTAHTQHGWSMQLTDSHKIDVLKTEESMELLTGSDNKGLKKEVQQDAALMQRIQDFVEKGLGNLAISVSMLKHVLKGQDAASVKARLQQFEQDTVGSLQGGKDGRSLRGLQGTVSVLIQRAEEACAGDAQLWEASRSLLGILSVLDPAGVPRQLFEVEKKDLSRLAAEKDAVDTEDALITTTGEDTDGIPAADSTRGGDVAVNLATNAIGDTDTTRGRG